MHSLLIYCNKTLQRKNGKGGRTPREETKSRESGSKSQQSMKSEREPGQEKEVEQAPAE